MSTQKFSQYVNLRTSFYFSANANGGAIRMRLEHYPVEKLKKELLEIIGKRLDLSQYKVFFFGLRVTNSGTDRSDIDVGIEGPEPVSGLLIEDIKEEIDRLPTLYTIDIVDIHQVTSKFREVALREIEPLTR